MTVTFWAIYFNVTSCVSSVHCLLHETNIMIEFFSYLRFLWYFLTIMTDIVDCVWKNQSTAVSAFPISQPGMFANKSEENVIV